METADHRNQSASFVPSHTLTIFWLVVVAYITLLAVVFTPMEFRSGSIIWQSIFFAAVGLLFLLGVAEVIMTARTKTGQPLRFFLILTGVAAAGTPLSIVMHNLVSAMGAMWFNTAEEGVFFILGLFIFPVLFLGGVIGTIVSLLKRRIPAGMTTV